MNASPVLLGSVRTEHARYDLYSDQTWRVWAPWGRDRDAERGLAFRYAERDELRGPATGRPGGAILADLAARYGGTVEMPERPAGEPGTIY